MASVSLLLAGITLFAKSPCMNFGLGIKKTSGFNSFDILQCKDFIKASGFRVCVFSRKEFV